MLWTLHNRASEARRPDTYLADPACVRLYESIDYDYERSFGRADDSHPMRSWLFDQAVRAWRATHPDGIVVELACGLETQFQRLDDGHLRWVCIDVPEALAVRRRFLPESARCRYVERSALDLTWLDEVDSTGGVFVSAQGLLMYFTEAEVKRLFAAMLERLLDVELMFDVIPRWFSKKTLRGFSPANRAYVTPPMPWGIDRDDVAATLRAWTQRPIQVDVRPFGKKRGLAGLVLSLLGNAPVLRNFPPCIAHVRSGRTP